MRSFMAIVAAFGFVSVAAGSETSPAQLPNVNARELFSYTAPPDPCALAESPTVNASIQLSSWFECQVNGFFPYPANGAWDNRYAAVFDKSVLASWNDTRHDYDSFLELYHSFNETLGRNFAPFEHGFINTLAVPSINGDKGGTVYAIGWEGGFHTRLNRTVWFTDATFALVKEINGLRKIVEMRESSNIPNTALLPEPNPWTCNSI